MCGIVTVFRKFNTISIEETKKQQQYAYNMLNTLSFRGPDELNLVSIGPACLGHTRLSIIDLSTGSQPIYNENQTVAVLLNGEIYNYQELRKELEAKGHQFRTLSDTEVIVHLYEEMGVGLFSRLNGMFAIVVYDDARRLLLAARDRMGEKPLLYWDSSELLVIGSELKALIKHPSVPRELNTDAVALYLNSLYVPAPHSIYRSIRKLKPAHMLICSDGILQEREYWRPSIHVNWAMKETEAIENFEQLFSEAVKMRVVADVPIGVFLSGGIDSSAVTAFMALNSSTTIRTFTVGFADEIDERPFARLVANRYGTDHTEIFIEADLINTFIKVMSYFDEPFGDSSAIPTYLVAQEARKFVKVILTGDGGDELFAGYDSYLDQKYLLKNRAFTKVYKTFNRFCLRTLGREPAAWSYPRTSSDSSFRHWHSVRTFYHEEELKHLMSHAFCSTSRFFSSNQWTFPNTPPDALTTAYCYDLRYYLPDDLLKKVDMASMLASLECRAPFLDHRLVEYALSIPPHLKLKYDLQKYVLKKALASYLPESVLCRRKTGFGAPVESWLKNKLREMVCDTLQPNCRAEAFIERQHIQKALTDVFSTNGRQDYRDFHKLWLLFVFEFWLRTYY